MFRNLQRVLCAALDRPVCVLLHAVLLLALAWSALNAEAIPPERRISWDAGVIGGIPSYTNIFCNVRESIPGTNIVAAGDGIADDYPAIQAALNRAPWGGESVVYLPPGTYRLSSPLQLYKYKSVLRGAGTETVLLADSDGIRISMPTWGSWSLDLLSGFTRGSSNLVAATNAPSDVYIGRGTHIEITQLNDGEFVARGTEGIHTDRALGQIVRVESAVGRTNFTISPPLYWTYTNSLKPRIRWFYTGTHRNTNFASLCGLESLRIQNRHSNSVAVKFERAAQCWMKDVEIVRGSREFVALYHAFRCEIRRCVLREAWDAPEGGGRSYGFNLALYSTANLLEDNIINLLRTPFLVGVGASGNVFGYNYVHQISNSVPTILMVDLSSHSAHPMFNLWEGNVAHKFVADFLHGSSSHGTVFRNLISGKDANETSAAWAVQIDATNLFYNIVGNVLGHSGMEAYDSPNPKSFMGKYVYTLGYLSSGGAYVVDPRVKDTLIRALNWDGVTATNGGLVLGGHTPADLPESLYLPGRPSWWPPEYRWPPVDPTSTTNKATPIPAQLRFAGVNYSTGSSQPPDSSRSLKPLAAVCAIIPSSGQGPAPLTVRFDTQAPAGATFLYDFGDGTTTTTANPVHIYTAPGQYTARIVVTCEGQSITLTKQIRVTAPN